MRSIRLTPLLGGVLVVGSMLCAAESHASIVTAIDTFTITRGTAAATDTVFYTDTFDDDDEPPSGGSFSGGAPGTYALLGTYPTNAETGGKLTLDSSLGGSFSNAAGGSRIQQRSALETNVDPDQPEAGLKQATHTFSVFGLFDLTTPPVIADGYGIFVSNGDAGGISESIDLLVRREESGNVRLRFQEQDFKQGRIFTLQLLALVAPTDADQIELQLRRASLTDDPNTVLNESNALTASYRFWDNGGAIGDFTALSAKADFFSYKAFARGGFFAVQAVPEPGTAALVLLGAAGLIASSRRRQRQPAPGRQ